MVLPDLVPGALFFGLVAVVLALHGRARRGRPRPPLWHLALAALAGAYVVAPALAVAVRQWRAVPGLPALPVITSGQAFLGVWVAALAYFLARPKDGPPRLPLWGAALIGAGAALAVPPLLDATTGRYQPLSLREDLNRCYRSATNAAGLQEVTNICDEPIVVGMCLPGERNPAPCAQSHLLPPGGSAVLDAGGHALSSLPGNPGGLTVVACRPPARPSRDLSPIGRGHDGVCLPPA
ncbi:MAG: hypothetical protein R3D63_11045 [Paracoccaceae bacterium]